MANKVKFTGISSLGLNLELALRNNAYMISKGTPIIVKYNKEENEVVLTFRMRKKEISIKKEIFSIDKKFLGKDSFYVDISEFDSTYSKDLIDQKEEHFIEESRIASLKTA